MYAPIGFKYLGEQYMGAYLMSTTGAYHRVIATHYCEYLDSIHNADNYEEEMAKLAPENRESI